MLSSFLPLSVRRLCAIGALAASALILIGLAIIYAARAAFFSLSTQVSVGQAAALVAGGCVAMALILLLAAKLLSRPPRRHPAARARPASASQPSAAAFDVGLLVAKEVEGRVKKSPGGAMMAAGLIGLAVGAAPDRTIGTIKSLARSIIK